MPSLFIIIIIWWVRWLWRRRIWETWVWIWVIWYVRYQIVWIVAWIRISSRCHTFCQWFMRWWQRVTCTPIIKYWWSVYRRMYRQWQYLFYCTNIVWIMDWSDVCQIGWNDLVRVGVIQINVNRVRIFFIPIYNWVGVIPIYRMFAPNFSTLKLFVRSSFLKIVLSLRFHTRFPVPLSIVPCHIETLMIRSDVFLTK